MTARAELWDGIEPARHLRLIDGALDEHDIELRAIRKSLAAELGQLRTDMQVGFSKCDENADTSRKYLIGILCSVVVAALMLAANVLILGGPS